MRASPKLAEKVVKRFIQEKALDQFNTAMDISMTDFEGHSEMLGNGRIHCHSRGDRGGVP
jgi:hypothetical protein